MNELKPEDVMRALEYCATNMRCYECPYVVVKGGKCHSNMVSDVLALLKKYQAENAENDAEIERLQGAVEQYEEERKYHFEMSRKRIAEAIDEFAAGCVEMAIGIGNIPVVYLESILKFAEKMKGEIYGNKQGKTSKP